MENNAIYGRDPGDETTALESRNMTRIEALEYIVFTMLHYETTNPEQKENGLDVLLAIGATSKEIKALFSEVIEPEKLNKILMIFYLKNGA